MLSMVGRGRCWAAVAALMVWLALAGAAPAFAVGEPEQVTAAAGNLRDGWYSEQSVLTPQLLGGGRFGQVFDTPVKGQVYA